MKLKLLISLLVLAALPAYALTNNVDVLKAKKVIAGDDLANATAVLQASKTVAVGAKSVFLSSDDGVGAVSQLWLEPKHVDIKAPAFRFYSQAGNPQIVTTNSTGTTIYGYGGAPVLISSSGTSGVLTNITSAVISGLRNSGLLYPTSDSTTNFVMVTDGAGNLSFRADVQASITNGFITAGAFAYTNVVNTFLTNQNVTMANLASGVAMMKVDAVAGASSGSYFFRGDNNTTAKYEVSTQGNVVMLTGNANVMLSQNAVSLHGSSGATIGNTYSAAGGDTTWRNGATNCFSIFGAGDSSGVNERMRIADQGTRIGRSSSACYLSNIVTCSYLITVPALNTLTEFVTNVTCTGALVGSGVAPRQGTYTSGVIFSAQCITNDQAHLTWQCVNAGGATPAVTNYGAVIFVPNPL